MGTPALIKFMDDENFEIFTALYRHMDGNPNVLGYELKKSLSGWEVIEGKVEGMGQYRFANGMGDLAKKVLRDLDSDTYGLSIMHPETECPDGGFVYIVSLPGIGQTYNLRVTTDTGEILFDGCLRNFDPKKVQSFVEADK